MSTFPKADLRMPDLRYCQDSEHPGHCRICNGMLCALVAGLMVTANAAAVWVDPSTKVVRGLLLSYSGDAVPVEVNKGIYRIWSLAYVAEEHGGPVPTTRTLQAWAVSAGHPENVNVPILATGMFASGGSAWKVAQTIPEKTVAAVPACISSGSNEKNEQPPPDYRI